MLTAVWHVKCNSGFSTHVTFINIVIQGIGENFGLCGKKILHNLIIMNYRVFLSFVLFRLLHMAIIQGEQKWALYFMMIATSADLLNIQNQQQQTPLHLAVLTQQHNLVEALVAGGADLEMRDRSGNTALHLACRTGDLECVRHLTTPPGGPQYRTSATQLYSYAPSLPTTIQDLAIKNYEGELCKQPSGGHEQVSSLNEHFCTVFFTLFCRQNMPSYSCSTQPCECLGIPCAGVWCRHKPSGSLLRALTIL